MVTFGGPEQLIESRFRICASYVIQSFGSSFGMGFVVFWRGSSQSRLVHKFEIYCLRQISIHALMIRSRYRFVCPYYWRLVGQRTQFAGFKPYRRLEPNNQHNQQLTSSRSLPKHGTFGTWRWHPCQPPVEASVRLLGNSKRIRSISRFDRLLERIDDQHEMRTSRVKVHIFSDIEYFAIQAYPSVILRFVFR